MKSILRHLSVLSIVLAAFLATGCYEEEVPFLMVDHEVVLVGPSSDKGTVVVESNVTWVASSEVDWITIDNGFGNHKGTFEFFVEANTTPNERSGKIKLESEDGTSSTTILVRQQSEGSVLTLSSEEITFTKDSGEYLMSVACNGDWQVASSADWCKVEPASGSKNGSFKITVDENATGADRAAVISVLTEADGVTQVRKINVYQSASNAALVISPEEKTLTAEAATFELDVITVGNWEASVDSDWLTLSASKGSGDSQLTLSATKNDTGKERVAIVTFATGAENENRIVRQLVVTQAAVDFYLVVPVTDYPLSLSAQTIEIPYSLEGSNVTVSATSNVKWMTVASVANGTATVAVEENGTAVAREGVITFITAGQSGEPVVRQVRVAQAPTVNLLDVLAEEYAVEWVGATFRIPIYSNTPVSVRSSESWCQVLVEGQDIVISVPENRTSYAREAIVTVMTASETGEILSRTTTIRQAAAYSELVASPATKSIYANAQTFVASIVTNNTWTAQSDSEWLTLDAKSGEGDYMLTVSAAANETGQLRTAVITIQTGGENSKRETATITVEQRPEQFYFEVPTRSYLVGKYGDEITIPYVTSGNEQSVKASASVDWINIKSVEDGGVKVVVAENKTAETRTGVVTITCTPVFGDPVSIDVTFTQSPTVNILDAFVDEIDVMARGDEVALPYYANTPVSISSSETWCHVSVTVDEESYKASGCCSYSDPQKIIKIEVDPNRTAEARIAYVTISTVSDSGEKLTKVITVRQAALNAALSVSPKNIVLPAHDAESHITVLTTGTWTVSYDCTWFELDSLAGFADGGIDLTAGDNDTGAQREAEIVIATGPENEVRAEQIVKVLQLERDTYLEIPESAYALTKEQQTLSVGYYAAGDFKDMQVNCSEEWITYDSSSSDETNLVFKVNENTTAKSRTATVTVTLDLVQGEPITKSFIVSQAPTVNILDVYVDKIEASAYGQVDTLAYYGNTPVAAISSAAWCTVAIDQKSDPQTVTITCEANRTAESRTAYVTLTTTTDKGEKLTKIITVEQESMNATLMVSPEKVVLPSMDAAFNLAIATTGDWEIVADAEWVKVIESVRKGTGDATVSVKALNNDTGLTREATLVVYSGIENEDRVEKTVQIIQLPTNTYIEVPLTSYSVSKEKQSLDVLYWEAGDIITSDVTCSESWLKFKDYRNNNLSFDIEENTTGEVRKATVAFSVEIAGADPITKTITITQAATVNVLETLVDYVALTPALDTAVLPAITNVTELHTTVADSWATAKVDIDEDTDIAEVSIIAQPNTTGKERRTTVTLTTATGKGQTLSKTITVVQVPSDQYFAILNTSLIQLPKKENTFILYAYASPANDLEKTVSIAFGADWADWEQIEIMNVNTKAFLCKAKENNTGKVRSMDVKISWEDETGNVQSGNITLMQASETESEFICLVDYLEAKPEGEDITLSFDTVDPLTATPSANWFTATVNSRTAPQTLVISAAENNTGKARTGYLTVSNGSKSYVITVYQPAKDTYFDVVSADVIYVSEFEQNIDILAYANINPGSVRFTPNVDWLILSSKDYQGNVVTGNFKVKENVKTEERTATVNIFYQDQAGDTHNATVKVVQKGAEPNILETLVDYLVIDGADPVEQTLSFISNKNVTAASSAAWCTATANGTDVTIVAVGPNTTGKDRTAYVTVTNEELKVLVTVFQPARDNNFEVLSPDTFYISAAEQTIELVAYATDPEGVAAVSNAAWFDAEDDGSSIGVVYFNKFKALENTTVEERTAIVKFTYIDEAGATQTAEVKVVQEAAKPNILEALVDYVAMDAVNAEPQTLAFVSNKTVNASSSAAWCTATVENDTYVKIEAADNTTGADRTAYVTVKNEELNVVVTVFQPANGNYFSILSSDVIYLTKEAQDVNIMAYANVNAKQIVPESSSSWFSFKEEAVTGTIYWGMFKAEANANTEERTAIVKFNYVDEKGATRSAEVKIVQEPTIIEPNVLETLVDNLVFEAAGAEPQTLSFISNKAVSVESSAAWCTATVEDDGRVTIVPASDNTTGRARTAYVTVKNEELRVTVTVTQLAGDSNFAILTGENMLIGKEAQSVMINAFANVNDDLVTMESNAAWLKFGSVLSGEGISSYIFNAEANTGTEARTATVTVTFFDETGKPSQEIVSVSQASANGGALTALKDYYTLDSDGEMVYIAFSSDRDVKVQASTEFNTDNWLTAVMLTTAGNGKELAFNAEANTTGKDRTGYLTLTDGVDNVTVTVFQPAKGTNFAILSGENMLIGKEAQSVMIGAYASVNVEKVNMESNADWLTYDTHLAGDDVTMFNFNAKANTGSEVRTATVTVTFFDKIGATTQKTVTVSQAAAKGGALAAVNKEYVVKAEGETIQLVLASDREIEAFVTPSIILPTWLSVESYNYDFAGTGYNQAYLLITAKANTTGSARVNYATLTDGVDNVIVTIYQPAAEKESTEFELINPEIMHIGAAETAIYLAAISSYQGKVKVFLAKDSEWLSFDETRDGEGGIASGTVKVAENTGAARTGKVKMMLQDKTNGKILFNKTITIAQAAASETVLDALVEEVTLAAKGEAITLSFATSDGIGTAVSSSAWLDVNVDSEKSTIDLTAEANTTGEPRTAYITVKKNGVARMVKVYQPATTTSYAILNPDRAVTSEGEEFILVAYGDGFGTAQTSAEWIHVNWNEDEAAETVVPVTVAVDANNTASVRQGEVKVTWTDAAGTVHSKSLKIVQSPTRYILDIYEDEVTVNYKSESHYDAYPVYAGKNLTSIVAKSSDTNWLSTTYSDSMVFIWFKDNEGAARTATVTLTAYFADGTSATKILTVNQLANPEVAPVDPEEPENPWDDKMETVLIKAGTFTMGSPTTEVARGGYEDQHEVTLTKDFYMGKYEVTNAQFAEFLNEIGVGSNGEYNTNDYGNKLLIKQYNNFGLIYSDSKWVPASGYETYPVIYVTWFGANEYAKWIGGALPTEAQWEYACRAGSTTAYSFGDNSEQLEFYAWYKTNSNEATHPVGKRLPNAWGLYDMHGNAWEWCSDWFDRDYFKQGAMTDPTGPATGTQRVLRGGSWSEDASFSRSACRSVHDPLDYINFIGFRVCFNK